MAKYERIAADIRGKIAAGDYPPGGRLPPEKDLLVAYRVSLPTLRQAIGVLRTEGLVEARHGVGTFVRVQAAQSGFELPASELRAVTRLAYEAGHLKQSRRTGWWRAGVRDPESVAEHSWRTAVLAWLIAVGEGADPERAVTIGAFHDLQESRTGDIEYVGRRYVTEAPAEAVARDQIRGLPAPMADGILSIVAEMTALATPEAECANDADHLECLLQAREYQRSGHADVQAWIETMAAAMRTETGKALAATALAADPAGWWREVSESWAARVRADGG